MTLLSTIFGLFKTRKQTYSNYSDNEFINLIKSHIVLKKNYLPKPNLLLISLNENNNIFNKNSCYDIVKKIIIEKPDILVVCTQESLLDGSEHFQHILKNILLKLEYIPKYKYKGDATELSGTNNLRTRIYIKKEYKSDKDISTKMSFPNTKGILSIKLTLKKGNEEKNLMFINTNSYFTKKIIDIVKEEWNNGTNIFICSNVGLMDISNKINSLLSNKVVPMNSFITGINKANNRLLLRLKTIYNKDKTNKLINKNKTNKLINNTKFVQDIEKIISFYKTQQESIIAINKAIESYNLSIPDRILYLLSDKNNMVISKMVILLISPNTEIDTKLTTIYNNQSISSANNNNKTDTLYNNISNSKSNINEIPVIMSSFLL
jgi:hypothetical protein